MVDSKSTNPEGLEYIRRVFHAWLRDNKKISNPESPDLAEKIELYRREFDTMEIQRCYFKDAKGEPNDFTFFVESVGVQTVSQIVDAGLASMIALMTRYSTLDVELPSNVHLQQGDARFPCIDVYFGHEGHTLGNLLSTYLTENNIEAAGEPRLSYVGYKIPHPLRPEMFVRIALQKTSENGQVQGMEEDIETLKTGARIAVSQACKMLDEQFRGMRAAWKSLAP
jgi:DNA-directed RNA polymerase subunit L